MTPNTETKGVVENIKTVDARCPTPSIDDTPAFGTTINFGLEVVDTPSCVTIKGEPRKPIRLPESRRAKLERKRRRKMQRQARRMTRRRK